MIHFFVLIEFNVYIRQNPDKAFIALRMISYIVDRFLTCYEQALIELLDFAESSPEMVEWDEVDKIFSVWMDARLGSIGVSNKAGRLLANIFRGVFTASCYLHIS